MSRRDRLIQTTGTVLRFMHARGLLGELPSGVVRRMASLVASQGTYIYRNEHGHVCQADLSDHMERIGFFGAHSSALIRHIAARLQPGDWVIDVGANVGLFSSAMSATVGRYGCVWAIEPLPRNVERLGVLKETNSLTQLRIFPMAVTSGASKAVLRLSAVPGGSGFASTVAPWAGDERVEVPAAALDDLVDAYATDGPLRLVKIDVEGSEAEVLAGAQATLRKYRPLVVCEFHDLLLRAAGSSSEELLAGFRQYGYHPQPPFGHPHGSLDGKIVDMMLVAD